jgi:hypothetical protein
MAAARPAERGKPKPPADRRVAAPATASTTESARGLMCRELHALSFSEFAFRATRKCVATMLFNLHFLSTTFSTACPRMGLPWARLSRILGGLGRGPLRLARADT